MKPLLASFSQFVVIFLIYINGNPIKAQCDYALLEEKGIANTHRSLSRNDAVSLNDYHTREEFVYENENLFELGFASYLILGALDAAGNLRIAADIFPNTANQDFIPGPVVFDQALREVYCAYFNRVWKIESFQVHQLITKFDSGTLNINDVPKDILEWPARGNTALGNFVPLDPNGMAPFFDMDGDGFYNVMKGDYPIALEENPDFIPKEFMFNVFNDYTVHTNSFGQALVMEVHQMNYVVDCVEDRASNKAVFTRLKFINKGLESLFDFKIGIWEDNNLGCYRGDLIGCDTLLNVVFTHDKDMVDSTTPNYCASLNHDHSSAISSKMYLNHKMESFVCSYASGATELVPYLLGPQLAEEFYNSLNGLWRDGTPLSIGGYGYNPSSSDITKFAFHDSPLDTGGWSMQSQTDFNFFDARSITSIINTQLDPGQSVTLDYVDHVMYDGQTNDFSLFENWSTEISRLKDEYNNFLDGTFSCQELTNNQDLEDVTSVNVFPNPFEDQINLSFGEVLVNAHVTVYNLRGQRIENQYFENTDWILLDLSDHSAGLYYIRIQDQNGEEWLKSILKN